MSSHQPVSLSTLHHLFRHCCGQTPVRCACGPLFTLPHCASPVTSQPADQRPCQTQSAVTSTLLPKSTSMYMRLYMHRGIEANNRPVTAPHPHRFCCLRPISLFQSIPSVSLISGQHGA
ncbi:unnamed protein product [Periconia digitata]|uniref:Uncharacterized protein n=1 Tax=Periconia digitata TaxID=1303443 RepID=A0A9W4XV54_9PLEO|nr:unnamed protein product [Periconia digitata]